MPSILVVDDEEDIRSLVKVVLEGAGYRVLTANGGQEALNILEEDNIDLVLLDIMMPDMSGWEVLSEMVKRPYIRKVHIAMLTVKTLTPDDYYSEKTEGIIDYINKPFSNKDLLMRLKKIFETVSNIENMKKRLQHAAPKIIEEYEELIRLDKRYTNLRKSLEWSMTKLDNKSKDYGHVQDAVEYGTVLLEGIKKKKDEYEDLIKNV